MNGKTIAILGITAALATGAAFLVARSGDSAAAPKTGGLIFESLADRVNDVARIEIARKDESYSVTRVDDAWRIPEKADYPVRFERVKETIVGMADLRALEPKTSIADRYPQLNVQDPKDTPADSPSSTLVTLKDETGNVLASAVIGNQRPGTPPGVYIRQPGEAQSWLAEGRLAAPGDFTQWIDPQILSVERNRIQSVHITPATGEPFSVERASQNETSFTVMGIPDGQTVKNTTAADAFASSLAYLTLEDIAPGQLIDVPTGGVISGPHLEFRTFDGLLVMIQLADKDGKTWARIAAAPDPAAGEPSPAIVEEANAITEKARRWSFALPAYKTSVMKVTMIDLIEDGRPMGLPSSLQGEDVTIQAPTPETPSIPIPFGADPPSEQPAAPPEAPGNP